MTSNRSEAQSRSSRRLLAGIGVGILLILSELLFFYGGPIFLEMSTAKVTGDGDSLMASSSVLERLRTKLEIKTNQKWFIRNNARNGYRMSIEVAKAQEARFFPYRLPWKTEDKIWVIGGTNDLVMGGPQRVERLLDAVQKYFERQRQAGYSRSSCFYTDILPRETGSDVTFESDRRLFNSLISERLAGLAYVIPSGSNPLLANPLNTQMYSDGTHLTEAGNKILAEDAYRAMNGIEPGEVPR